ncbi:MAG: cellulase family glycosylhydrolase [Polyangiaceae bacterium]
MRKRALRITWVAALACAACREADPTPLDPPKGRVAGGFIRDDAGRALLLRGMNLAGAHKAAPYFSFHTLPDFQRVRDAWGMNAIRFLVTWSAIEPAKGVFDDAYLEQVRTRMQWAREAGLFVVLDMHQDVYGEGFASGGGDGAPRWSCDEASYASFVPNAEQWYFNYLTPEVTGCYDHFWKTPEIRAEYIEAWARLARSLGDYDDVILGFDPMNEPYWGSTSITAFEAEVLQPFYEDVVKAVRAERPTWIAFIEPASSRNLGIPTGLTRMTFSDVVYSPHSYDRDAESGVGFDAAHRDAVLSNAADLATEARALGAALWIGEYGGMADKPGIVDYMTAEYDAFASVAAGSTYWAYDAGGGYSVLDADMKEREALVGALVRPWPERVAGAPVRYAFDPLTKTFTLLYRPDRAITAPTIVSVPARAYPTGYTVSCGACAFTKGDGSLEITTPDAGAEVTVSIAPQ